MNSWNQYVYNLYQRIDEQDRTIRSLETRIQQLENNQQNQQTPERIEYHFDQLKIENLNGTLHIGAAPDDLNNIEDFSVPEAGNSTIKQQLLPDLNTYLNEHGKQLIRDLAAQHHVAMDHIDPNILIEDMAKQLPERIAHYEAEARQNKQELNEEQLTFHIGEQIKREIYHSLNKYMEGTDQHNEYGGS
ncbi:spore germination protein PC [Lentibacillus halodurans]|uniref:Spore germination protein PC n=1 Tax=Lentibacillus halodurans TaxID=237679 RepID=A0A1I0VZX9_9BACI|nr:spore germination protein GerPC [Lentibacillus halodurans]SFA82015.1 spore germination protein PC [Lentibacillus halodurans]